MRLGMMNDPVLDAAQETRWAAEHGFDFIDLTMEGPAAAVEQIDVAAIKAALDQTGLGIVGHTAWYLPFGSPVREVRAGAVEAVCATFEAFATLGARSISVHTDKGVGAFAYEDTLRWNAESFAALAERALEHDLVIAVENVFNNFNTARAFRTLLDAHPALRFHLDLGHANIKADRTKEFLKAHGDKLIHVHVSDNKRTGDDHLPIGVGTIDWREQLGLLRAGGYDGTITLEIFTPERDFLIDSAARVRRIWNEA